MRYFVTGIGGFAGAYLAEHLLAAGHAVGVIRVLEAIRGYEKRGQKRVRFYQAGSSEMFGSAKPRQNELTRTWLCAPRL